MSCKVYKCRFLKSHTTKGHKCGKCGKYGHGEGECESPVKLAILTQYYNDVLEINTQCGFNCDYKMYHTTDAHHCNKCGERYHCENTCSKNITYKISCPLCKVINIIPNEQSKVFGQTDNCCICMVNNINVFFPICGHICICNECLIPLNSVKPKYDVIPESKLINDGYDINNIKKELKEYPSFIIINIGMGCTMYIRRLSLNNTVEGYYVHADDWGYGPIEHFYDFIKGYCNTQITQEKND